MRYRPIGMSFAVAAALAAATAARASTLTTSHYSGVAYAAGSQTVRYREEHWVFDDGGARERLVLYRCPDGRPFARKNVRYTNTAWTPDVDYDDARSGYRESVKVDGPRLSTTVVKNARATADSTTLDVHPDTVVDAGFDDFVRAHWDAITQSKGLTARFVVPSRGSDLRLNIRPDGDADAPSVRRFRMALDGWLGGIAPTVTLLYTADTHRLVGFEGLSNVKGDDGKNQQVRIVFTPRDDQPPVSLDQVADARRLPLVERCAR
ncbi:hypothetical protein P3W24_13220 [Luteibacter sp. PPL201]|uniref:DUF3108 domain-containing protein n=1 Tax=Luteibacter sahnii TaxID=3021977 RepID=A0ABT6BFG2_9GAMM|nr:hypothetical protein [Luteibacter sp. PPL193]MDY1549355.1 hypothetical protein [Luteibacter sp. PPL193]